MCQSQIANSDIAEILLGLKILKNNYHNMVVYSGINIEDWNLRWKSRKFILLFCKKLLPLHSLLRGRLKRQTSGGDKSHARELRKNKNQKKVDKNFVGNKKGCTFAKFSAYKKARQTKRTLK